MMKRMLSLLLTLVMTLSLCVPALAADEFAAEAVTEVEEQAPVAPVEPEAPEAEEPAAEADAPEAAVVLVDEPATVAGIDVKDENVEALVAAVKNAEKYEDGVLDGTYHGAGYIVTNNGAVVQVGSHGQSEIKGLTIEKTPLLCCGEYVFWLARARYAMDQLEDAAGSLRDSDVINITNNLNAAVKGLSTGVGDGCVVALDTATHGFNYGTFYRDFRDAAAEPANEGLWYFPSYYDAEFKAANTLDWIDAYAYILDALQDGDFDDLYRADYVEALKAAVYDILQYLKENASGAKTFNELSHKELLDLVKSTSAVASGSAAEVAARTPNHAEASLLKDLIVEINNLLKGDYSADTEGYVKNKVDSAAWNKVGAPDGYWKDSMMSNLQDYITLRALNAAIDEAEGLIDTLRPNYYSARIHDVYLVNASDTPPLLGELRVFFNKTDSGNGVEDNHNYVVKVECNSYEVTATKWDASTHSHDWNATLDKPVTISFVDDEWAFVRLTDFEKNWTDIDQVPAGTVFVAKLYAYADDGTAENSPLTLVDTCTITIAQKGSSTSNLIYTKPEIREAGYIIKGNDANAQLGVEDNMLDADVFYLKLNLPGKTNVGTEPDYGKVKIELVDPNGKKVTLITDDAGETYYYWALSQATFADQNSVNGKFSGLDIVPGDWTFNLYLKDKSNLTGDRDGYPTTPNDSVKVTVPGITTYSKYATLLSQIEKLSNYETMVATHDAITHEKTTTAAARAHAALVLSEVKAITDKAATLVNCEENRDAVDQMVKELSEALGLLTDMADYSALNALITLAQGLSSSDYTAMSWHYFQDKNPIKTAQAVVTAAWGKDNQMVVDRAVRSLQYDINALVVAEGKISKAALEAAIIAAKALKEEDYTAESWAAADLATAIAAAQKVYDKPNATQAEVDQAVVDLNAAVALLVEVTPPEPEGPKAPASGTGWTYYDAEWYFFKNGELVSNYWVGYTDGASKWANNWYYVGADGKMATGFQYLDNLKGGKAWYMLQDTPKNGEVGKMLTGWQWTNTSAGTGYFSPKYGSQGACTYTTAWGSYSAATGLWGDGQTHIG